MNKTTADTSTSTTSSQWTTYTYNSEKGWECPRCGKINAPWIRQCDCSRNNQTITWISDHLDYKPERWNEVTCEPDTFRIHPESGPIWKVPCGLDSATIAKPDLDIVHTYVTSTNNIAGGSDYQDDKSKQWVNVVKECTNSATSVDSPWHQYSTLTNQLDKVKYKIEELKETK